MATEKPPVTAASSASRSRASRSRSRSATASPASVAPGARSGCRRASRPSRSRSWAATATTPGSRTRRTGRSTSSTSARLRVAGLLTEPTEPDLIVVSVGSFADPTFPPADGVRLRLPPSSVGAAARLMRLALLEAPRPAVPLLQRRLLRASPGAPPTPSSTWAGQSRCGTAVARWRRPTPTSIRFAPSPPSRAWSPRPDRRRSG